MIRAGIVGAAGYTGGELIRILLRHPKVEIVFAQSKSQAGIQVSSIHQDLLGETEMTFSDDGSPDIDVLFLCVGHGDAKKFLEHVLPMHDSIKIIDLSQDFRLKAHRSFGGRDFVYGLPELNRGEIMTAQNIANPGCFATALQLSLLPLVAAGFSGDVYTTGITGATGAGQGLAPSSHFAWRANNIQAYKSLSHQHLSEVGESLASVAKHHKNPKLNFIPWRGDFARGIFVSQQMQTDIALPELREIYKSYYADHHFTTVSDSPIYLKQVVNTNKCLIQIEQEDGQTVIHAAIDNLLKGASGQAVQNMNLMFGLEETTGLNLKASYF
jgi:N-acetyl-gamma-glutamyl-phosphate reductase